MTNKQTRRNEAPQVKQTARRHQTSRGREGPEARYEEPDLLALQRAVANPDMARPADILALQRMVGNQVVQRLLAQRQEDVDFELDEEFADRSAEPVNDREQKRKRETRGEEVCNGRVQTVLDLAEITPLAYDKIIPEGGEISFKRGAYDPPSPGTNREDESIQSGKDGEGRGVVQRAGLYSPINAYISLGAADSLAEREFAYHREKITFTKFSSCIGMIGMIKNGDHYGLVGIHLGLEDEMGNFIRDLPPNRVVSIIDEKISPCEGTVKLFGHVGLWRQNAPGIMNAILAMDQIEWIHNTDEEVSYSAITIPDTGVYEIYEEGNVIYEAELG